MRRILTLAAMAGLTACMPVTTVKTVDSRPTIAIVGAGDGSQLYVDGLNVGSASRFNGDPGVLRVEPGTHTIMVKQGDAVIHNQTVFVESELKTITIGR